MLNRTASEAARGPSSGPREPERKWAPVEWAMERAEPIEILLDRNNFVLHNRCSMNRLYVRVGRRTRRPQVATRQQKTTSGRGPAANGFEVARMRLLSMIITVESVALAVAERGPEPYRAGEVAADRPNGVKLRANLTELYICFDAQGNIAAQVSRGPCGAFV